MKYSTWFVFAFYVVVSLVLLFSFNTYQNSVYLTSANSVTGAINEAKNGVTGYFNLYDINRQLQQSNAELQKEVFNLREQLRRYKSAAEDSVAYSGLPERFNYVIASVINNSTRMPHNYFTVDKGAADGLKPGMGVVDQNGVVGIVNVAGPHTARIISVLTQGQRFSVKLKDTSFVGSLTWNGGDPSIAYVEEVPRHAKFNIGDTVVTSGFSTTFPEGIPLGMIMARIRSTDDNFFTLKVRLSSDFRSISTVRILTDNLKTELDSLQTMDRKEE